MTSDYLAEYRNRRWKRTHCDMPTTAACHGRARHIADLLNAGVSMRDVAKELYPDTNYEGASTNIRGMLRKHGYVVDRRESVTVRLQ